MRLHPLRVVGLTLLSLLPGGFALAEEGAPDPAIATMAGPWDFNGDGQDAVCRLVFGTAPSIRGFVLEVPADCAKAYPILQDASSWNYDPANDRLFVNDPLGKAMLAFEQTENGLYQSSEEGRPAYTLINQDEADLALPPATPEMLEGDWMMAADDDPLSPRCPLTLSLESQGEGAFGLVFPQSCPGWIAALKLVSWTLKDGAIAFRDAAGAEVAVLARGDAATWRGTAPNGQTLVLSLYAEE